MSRPYWPVLYRALVRDSDARGRACYLALSVLGYGVQLRHRDYWGVLIQEFCTSRFSFRVCQWNVCIYGRKRW